MVEFCYMHILGWKLPLSILHCPLVEKSLSVLEINYHNHQWYPYSPSFWIRLFDHQSGNSKLIFKQTKLSVWARLPIFMPPAPCPLNQMLW